MKFADFKIGVRLGVAFGAVVLLSVGSAGLALKELASIEHNLDDIVKDNNVKIKFNHEMSESVHVVSRHTQVGAVARPGRHGRRRAQDR